MGKSTACDMNNKMNSKEEYLKEERLDYLEPLSF